MSGKLEKKAFWPVDLAEALAIKAERPVTPVAGGTDLMVQRRRWSGVPRFQDPPLFVSHLSELKKIEERETANGRLLQIGAACTFAALLEDTRIPSTLAAAISEIGGPAIKNVATIGGNICNASPAGDTLPTLYALDTSVELANSSGSRRVPIDEFITGPGTTILAANELLVSISVPLHSFDTELYRKVGTRRANALSKLSFIGLAKRDRAKILDFRVAFGAVAPTVVRSREIEARISGQPKEILHSLALSIRKAYAGLIHPITDQRSTARYRETTALRLLDSFLDQLEIDCF